MEPVPVKVPEGTMFYAVLVYVGVAMVIAGLWALNPSLGFAAGGAALAYYAQHVVQLRMLKAMEAAKMEAMRRNREEVRRQMGREDRPE